MASYKLTKTETGRKSGKFLYQVIDENGTVISSRTSDRDYVACTISGSHYFGRLDLIGKGEHGNWIKMAQGYFRGWENGKLQWKKTRPVDQDQLDRANLIAYLDNK